TKSSISLSGSTTIRCTSSGFCVARRTASTTSGPIVRFGTKRPSITSTWIQSPPASSEARTSSASRPKSAERIEGAIRIGCGIVAAGQLGDRLPVAAATPQQLVRGVGAIASCRIEFERRRFVILPVVENRLHNGPPGFDAVGALEQHRIADHAIVNQG